MYWVGAVKDFRNATPFEVPCIGAAALIIDLGSTGNGGVGSLEGILREPEIICTPSERTSVRVWVRPYLVSIGSL